MKRNDDMEKTIQTLRQENLSLKRQIGGLRTSNANYKKQVEKLKARVEHYKDDCAEGDSLYENELEKTASLLRDFKAEVAELKRQHRIVLDKVKNDTNKKIASLELRCKELDEQVKNKESFIDQLQQKASEQKVKISELESEIEAKNSIINECDETIAELQKPWWKKIF